MTTPVDRPAPTLTDEERLLVERLRPDALGAMAALILVLDKHFPPEAT